MVILGLSIGLCLVMLIAHQAVQQKIVDIKSSVGNTITISPAGFNSFSEANNTVQPLQNVASISLFSLIGAVIAGSAIILLTMIMIVRERRREIGILKAIGASNTRVIFQFMSEAITLTIAGAIIGMLIGIVGGNPVTNTLVTNSATNATTITAQPGGGGFGGGAGGGFRSFGGVRQTGGFLSRNGTSLANSIRNINTNVGWNILAYGFGAAILIAIIGSSLAGWMIARVKPYEVMRAE